MQSAGRRMQLIIALMKQKEKATQEHARYLSAIRRYGPEDRLYMREAHFILAVDPDGGTTMSQAAQRLGVTQGAASQLAQRLEKKGYIIRQKSGKDHRRTLVFLTARGRQFLQEHTAYDLASLHTADQNYLSSFTEEQLELFMRYERAMERVFAAANQTEPAAAPVQRQAPEA